MRCYIPDTLFVNDNDNARKSNNKPYITHALTKVKSIVIYTSRVYQTIFRRHCRRTSEMKTFKRNIFFLVTHPSLHLIILSALRRKKTKNEEVKILYSHTHTHTHMRGSCCCCCWNFVGLFDILERREKSVWDVLMPRKKIPMLNYSFLSSIQ